MMRWWRQWRAWVEAKRKAREQELVEAVISRLDKQWSRKTTAEMIIADVREHDRRTKKGWL